jgi:hypothetical protein
MSTLINRRRIVGLLLGLLLSSMGIAGMVYAADFTLAWDAPPTGNPTGYVVSWGTESRRYTDSLRVGAVTKITVTGLQSKTPYYFAVKATDGTRESDYSNEVFVSSLSPFVLAINAGGPTVKAQDGIVYHADTYYRGGKTYPREPPPEPDPYLTERFDDVGDLGYEIPLPNGDYRVTLKFAEIWAKAADMRKFHVDLEGVRVLSDVDIYAKVGPNTPHDVPFMVSVTDGALSLMLTRVKDKNNPKISAILIEAAPSVQEVLTPTTNGRVTFQVNP